MNTPSSGRRLRIRWRSRLPRRVRTASVSTVDFSDMRQIGGSYLITELTQDGYTGGELAGVARGTGRHRDRSLHQWRDARTRQLALQTFRCLNAALSIGNNSGKRPPNPASLRRPSVGEGVAGAVSAGMIEDAKRGAHQRAGADDPAAAQLPGQRAIHQADQVPQTLIGTCADPETRLTREGRWTA